MDILLLLLVIILAVYAASLNRRLNETTRRWRDLEQRVDALEKQLKEVKSLAEDLRPVTEPVPWTPVPAVPHRVAPAPVASVLSLTSTPPQPSPSPPVGIPVSAPTAPSKPRPTEPARVLAAPAGALGARGPGTSAAPGPVPASVAVPPAPSLSLEGGLRSRNLEEVVGTNWLNKLGVVILVIGVALFLAYQLQHVGPLGKVIAGYLLSAIMVVAGVFFESHDRYRLLARAGIGGGWALAFFTTYAMYHVPAAKVISSQPLDLALLLVVGGGMVAHSLTYRVQMVTGIAFLLAFATFLIVSFSRPDPYSVSNLYANAILALGLIVIALRLGWFEMELLGILAAYLTHYFWLWPVVEKMAGQHHEFPGYLTSSLLLALYWLAFRCSYLVRRPADDRVERISTAAALLNTALFLYVMGYQSAHPELAFRFFLSVGAVELSLGQLPITRRRRTAFVVLTTLGAVLLVAAFPFKFSGSSLSLWWLVEAEALFLAGVFTREIVFRRLGVLAGLTVAGHMISIDAARVFGQRMDGAYVVHEVRLGLVFAVAALLFYFNAHWIPQRWTGLVKHELDRFGFRLLSYAGCVLALAGAWIVWPDAWAAVVWMALALGAGIAGNRLRSSDLQVQGNSLALATVIRVLVVNIDATAAYHHVTQRLVTIAIIAALLYAFSRWSELAARVRTRRLGDAYRWAASGLLMLLAWYELRPASVVDAWAVLALVLFELGFWRPSLSLRLQSYAVLVSAFVRIFFVNLNADAAPGGLISPRVYTTVPLALAFFYIYSRLVDRSDDFLARDRRLRAAELHCCLGMFSLIALMRFEFDPDWVVAAWSALALALVAVAWKTGRRIFLDQGLVVALLVLFRTLLHNFYERSYFPAPFWHSRLVCVGLAVALLFAALFFAFELKRKAEEPVDTRGWFARMAAAVDRHPDQVFFFVPLLLLTVLLAVEVNKGLVTLSWGIEAVVVFMFALRVGERSFRLAGLGLLLLCVAKILVIDVWEMNPRDRYLTFIVLGSALVLVSFLYSRYRETIRQYL